MNFLDSVKHVFGHYAAFAGRAPRSEYWWWILFTFVAGLVATVLDMVLGTAGSSGTGIISGILDLILLVPGIAVAARRLHDVNRSGWWQLIGVTVIGLIPLLIWLCRRGDEFTNDYGPDPLGGSGSPTAIARPGPGPAGQSDNLAELERLGRLRDQGILTQSEFDQQKARLLGSSASAA